MGNQGSSPHEPLDRAQAAQNVDLKMKSSVRSSLRRARAGAALSPPRAGMERLRRSFRESFRRRKGSPPESARPHQWHADEAAVRAGTCTFPVKYLGCVEVFESRGMQVCEEALKVLRNSRRRPVRAVLHVSGDGLRVVEEETKGLIVDQTIEKVSFCAPDRNHERGFSYICRDGTTRRWMCHGFLASRDSGERLSHAVGCAFAACLERKQRRDKECAVSMSIDAASHAFTRQGSFRKSGMTARRASEADAPSVPAAAHAPPAAPAAPALGNFNSAISPAANTANANANSTNPANATRAAPHNPFAVERPHAAPHLLERQGSFRGFAHLNNSSPFKRQMSLRISELPSNLERQRAGLGSPPRSFPPAPAPASNITTVLTMAPAPAPASVAAPVAAIAPLALTTATSQPDNAPVEVGVTGVAGVCENGNEADPVAALCRQLQRGLRALAEEPVPAGGALPHPDAWLGRVARAPPLAAAGRAASYAGATHAHTHAHAALSTNPFLAPLPDATPAPL